MNLQNPENMQHFGSLNEFLVSKETVVLWFTAEFPGDWVRVWCLTSAGEVILAERDTKRAKRDMFV